jgi:hypothetical protein
MGSKCRPLIKHNNNFISIDISKVTLLSSFRVTELGLITRHYYIKSTGTPLIDILVNSFSIIELKYSTTITNMNKITVTDKDMTDIVGAGRCGAVVEINKRETRLASKEKNLQDHILSSSQTGEETKVDSSVGPVDIVSNMSQKNDSCLSLDHTYFAKDGKIKYKHEHKRFMKLREQRKAGIYSCDVCCMDYYEFSRMKQHMLLHSLDKPFE